MRGFKSIYFNTFNKRNINADIQQLAQKTGVHIVFPFYHVVSDNPVPHINKLYRVKTTAEFKQDLEFLLQHFTPLHIDDYAAGNYEKGKLYFVLSFDDGLSEMITTVAPILNQLHIPATFFLNSAFINNKDLFYRYKVSLLLNNVPAEVLSKQIAEIIGLGKVKIQQPDKYLLQLTWKDNTFIDNLAAACKYSFSDFLNQQQPYLTDSQISTLLQAGHSIGAHSIDHPNYSTIDPQLQFLQTSDSMHAVAEQFNLTNKYFAFPFTADGVVKELFPAMYNELNIRLSFGTAGMRKSEYTHHIERIPAESDQYNLPDIIRNEYAYHLLKKRFGK